MSLQIKSKKLEALALSALLAVMAPLSAAVAQDADTKGFNVAAKADRSDRGFGDSKVQLEMILRNASGKSAKRTLEITTLELPDEKVGDKSLILFSSPGDIDGTALLSHAQILKPDNQWLFLPALKRTKRISSKNKSGPFVGSEFAFEDITGQELNKYEYTWLRAEKCGAFTCDVVERRPLYQSSGYTRQIGWIDQKHNQPRKLEYYDRRGALLKTQSFEKYKLYKGKYWRPLLQKMVNHQTGKSTELHFGPYQFGNGLRDRDFVKGALERLG
ncbi:MAG: outer membrane lipoprotein-sorting protein [Thalassovita sp.]